MAAVPTTIAASWNPPPFSELSYTECGPVTKFFAELIDIEWSNTTSQDMPVGVAIDFLNSTLPSNLTSDAWPTPDDLTLWYLSVWDNDSYANNSDVDGAYTMLVRFAFENCSDELCENLEWTGDQDVTGIGMMISYYLSATLATAFFLILVSDRHRPSSDSTTSPYKSLRARRFFRGFRDTIDLFLDTALIFASAMLAAAVVRYASAAHVRDGAPGSEDFSVYRLLASVYMSAFAVFPCLILQSLAPGLRHRFLRQALWLVLVALTVTLEVQYVRTYKQKLWGRDLASFLDAGQSALQSTSVLRESVWLWACEDPGLRDQLTHALTASHAIMGLNLVWLIYYFAASVLPRGVTDSFGRTWLPRKKPDRGTATGMELREVWIRARPLLRTLNGLLCSVMMWVLIALFTAYRNDIAARTGPANQDLNWTFGQVLALATWLPVVLHILNVLNIVIYGEGGLKGRLSAKYEDAVVERKSSSSSRGGASRAPSIWRHNSVKADDDNSNKDNGGEEGEREEEIEVKEKENKGELDAKECRGSNVETSPAEPPPPPEKTPECESEERVGTPSSDPRDGVLRVADGP